MEIRWFTRIPQSKVMEVHLLRFDLKDELNQTFVVKKNVREGTWNLYEDGEKVLTCKQIQDHSFPLDGWNDDVKFSKGMSLRHAMGTSSMSVIRKMLEANSSPSTMTWLAKDKRETKEEEVSKLENIVRGLNEKDRTLYSISRLMYAVGECLSAQDKPDKVLLQSLVAVKSSDKEEEKSLRKMIAAQNRRVDSDGFQKTRNKDGPVRGVRVRGVRARSAKISIISLSLNLSLPHIYLFLQVYHSNHKNITCITHLLNSKINRYWSKEVDGDIEVVHEDPSLSLVGQQQEQQDEEQDEISIKTFQAKLLIKTFQAKLYRLYVVFEREVRESIFFHDVYSIMSLISGVLEHQLTRNLSTSYSLAIKALEYYEILNLRFALEHRYSSRGREEKKSDSITVHGFQISKSKLRDQIERIVRSKISSIGYPLLAFTRRALQDTTMMTMMRA